MTASQLPWGRHYAAVRPTDFRIDYQINPYMDRRRQPDPALAQAQWDALVTTMEEAGARVDVIDQRADAPDMVYAMNLGLAITSPTGPRVVVSHMRYPERRLESPSAHAWFTSRGFRATQVGEGGIGPCFEAGDAFPFGGCLLVGFGPRTEELALKHLATALDVRVNGVRIVHPGMYHLDLAFCPLDDRRALVYPAAFDDASAQALFDLIPEPVLLSNAEAMTFCANSIVIGRTIVMPVCPARVRRELERAGFEVVLVDVGEFHKGGGSIRCLTNPLDIALGRDLDLVPGGEVVLPR
jgi:N-dimethylarginine dimethylaminohydrolase